MIENITNNITAIIGTPYVVKTWWIVALITIIFALYESWWRRWFGGHDLPKWLKWLDHRFVAHCVNVVALFSICYYVRGLNWIWSLYATLVFQILFWTMTFGMYFDIGHSGKPESQYDYDEYNKTWFSKILNWCFTEEHRYTAFYDYVGMFIRFTYPLFLVFWIPSFNFGLVFLGTIVAMAYGVCWVMRDKSLLKNIGPTSLVEYISGFFAGLFWVISELI